MALTANVRPHPFGKPEEQDDGTTIAYADIEAGDDGSDTVVSRASIGIQRDADGKVIGLSISVRPSRNDTYLGFNAMKEVSFGGAYAVAVLRALRSSGAALSASHDRDLADVEITISDGD